jgi:spore germination cell wall hydrolase CwlJ-like protein
MTKIKVSGDSYKAADAIISGDYTDPTNGSTHYVNEKVSPDTWWLDGMKAKKKGTKQIGNHLFGNADDNVVYDGKAWVKRMLGTATVPRPKARP